MELKIISKKCKKGYKHCRCRKSFLFCVLVLSSLLLVLSSCGYHMVGSRFLPFDSINIKHVDNRTYEPRLEEKLHNALSEEFINQGIKTESLSADLTLEAVITRFELSAIGAVDESVREQNIIMLVDIKVIDKDDVIEFKSMGSPILITFQTTGTVPQTVDLRDRATIKASREIAKDIVSRIIMNYAK